MRYTFVSFANRAGVKSGKCGDRLTEGSSILKLLADSGDEMVLEYAAALGCSYSARRQVRWQMWLYK